MARVWTCAASTLSTWARNTDMLMLVVPNALVISPTPLLRYDYPSDKRKTKMQLVFIESIDGFQMDG